MPYMKTIEERFWTKVDKKDEYWLCWLWRGALKWSGYGLIQKGRVGEGLLLAHRVSWEIHFGPIPDGLCVLHSCDVARVLILIFGLVYVG
jgi:hypothetical protein